ncbi:hypothetical protein Tco_0786472, partial [Tanacetum coccineum]
NDAHYGHYCTPQIPIISNLEPCYNQNYDEFPQTLTSFQQQILCCDNCGSPHATFECQPMNQNFDNSNSFGFDQFQPPQYPVIHHPPQEMSIQDMEDLKQQYLDEMKSLINEIQIKDYRNEKIDIGFRMECEIKINELKENFNGMSIASPPDSELVSLEEVKDFDPKDREIDTALKDNPTPSTDSVLKSPSSFPYSFLEETDTSDNSLPESEIFCFNLEDKSSGNPTSYIDLSLPDYEAFFCDSELDSGDFTMDVVEDIFDNPTRVHVPNVLPTHSTLHLDSNFTYVVWIFLLFLTIALDFEASRAHGFILRSLELHILSFIMGIQYPNLIN